MRKIIIYFSFIFFVCCMGFGIYCFFSSAGEEWYLSYDDLSRNNLELRKEYVVLQRKYNKLQKEYNQYDKFREVLSKHDYFKDYDKETNNCYHQAQQIQKELLVYGIRSSIFINADRTHAWNGIWVEPTDGSFNVWGNQGPISEVRDDNLHVICN